MWCTLAGALLIVMALASTVLARLPLSTAMLYLAVGAGVSPIGLGLAAPAALDHAQLLERLTEVVVVVSLFSCGLKLSPGLEDRRWLPPIRLALTSMLVTAALIAAIGVYLLHLPLGAAILLGGILAPTDPVLASDVQVAAPGDHDPLRFALTGEGGLNDGTAFPIVMLGLGLLGLHELGPGGSQWLVADLLWASIAGIGVGALLGTVVGRLVIYLRHAHKEAVGLDNFLALGLIALTYGTALLLHGYGFLAAFAAGVALRRVERRASATPPDDADTGAPSAPLAAASERLAIEPDAARVEAIATHPHHAAAFMAHAMLSFNEQLERIGELIAVVVLGTLLWAVDWHLAPWWFVPLLLLVVRPVAVAVGLAGSAASGAQRRLIGWFGIRGIGSIYYLAYAINHGLDADLARVLTALTALSVVTSIVLHGITVTPLMALYNRSR